MEPHNFVYVTYILSTPEKVWNAIVNPEVTSKYWSDPLSKNPAHINVSEWKVGSEWKHVKMDEEKTVDIIGKVLEVNPPNKLVISWSRPKDIDDESKHSHVTFDIEPYSDGLVRLVVTHKDLDSQMFAGISAGWPSVLSNLKTFLESGLPLAGHIPKS
ncbi:SRPBCC family protein [Leptospira bandrabouensis]|uniref:Polyketide cyclase n=1 Tax=Leptospira bandrabouensis TaxID=2484903 RepID=A0A6H3NRC1_9LEPT|nr:SRPBCC family protein [Leptospira bandrabouensis]MCG6143758.1 SRPBCC family protein [Leptospira bandrabouensis]MCG6151202.1 SRPBCC family protein [Leptospira bandrabouensis]MCG6159418.1 SRPBCC family protein [Leptospira bandrabouensis]MCG6163352.1 SRPBCC family protein [Leptospira bandrabouensis]MCW7457272.1 SRPBCC family protein [Leptospira bandrabouensis]